MRSRTHRRFWHEFNRLSAHVQRLAREKFQLWIRDPFHPSMQFKPLVGNVRSVRIGDHYHAIAQKHGDLVVWFRIDTKRSTTISSGSCAEARMAAYSGVVWPDPPIETGRSFGFGRPITAEVDA